MSELAVREEEDVDLVEETKTFSENPEFDPLRPWSDVVDRYFKTKVIGFSKVRVCPICSAHADVPQIHWDDHRRITLAIRYLGGKDD